MRRPSGVGFEFRGDERRRRATRLGIRAARLGIRARAGSLGAVLGAVLVGTLVGTPRRDRRESIPDSGDVTEISRPRGTARRLHRLRRVRDHPDDVAPALVDGREESLEETRVPPLQHRVDHRLDVVVQKVVERVAMEQAETRGEGVAREHRLRDGVGLRTQEDGERVHRLDPHQAQRRSHHAPRRALPGRVVVHVEERHESREELHARRERLGRRLANGGLRPADFRREKRLHRLRRTGGAFRVHDGDGDVEDVHQGTRVRAVVRGDGGPNLHALVRLHVHARAAARVRIAAVRGPLAAARRRAIEELSHRRLAREFRRQSARRAARDAHQHLRRVRVPSHRVEGGVVASVLVVDAAERVEKPVEQVRLRQPRAGVAAAHGAHQHPPHVHPPGFVRADEAK